MTFVHVAAFAWKESATADEITSAMARVAALQEKVPGVIEIWAGPNSSRYAEGYTHVVMVRGESQEAIDAYRAHPDHQSVAADIDAMEERGIGIDFETEG